LPSLPVQERALDIVFINKVFMPDIIFCKIIFFLALDRIYHNASKQDEIQKSNFGCHMINV
jgi:hypothetical protein